MLIEITVVKQRLAEELPQWQLNSDETGICRTYATIGWKSSLMVANAIGFLAESAWHHPDIVIRYSTISIDLTTHSESGITEQDLALAKQIEELVFAQQRDDVFRVPPVKHALLKPD